MILTAVMDQLGDRLDTIAGLNVHRFPAKKITPPSAIVGYPEDGDYDVTGGGALGMDQMTIPVSVLVGDVTAKGTRDLLSPYVSGSGPSSFKQVLESGVYTAMHEVTVKFPEFAVVTIAGVDYLGATFPVDVAGSGGA